MTVVSRLRRIDICVCTFRRPELIDTLQSLCAMTMPVGFHVGVIVADNDDAPSARQLVQAFAQSSRLPVRYVHCPARNISIARNACLDASSADYVAFIDDDETASRLWLDSLVHTAEASNADAVLGPVKAVYQAGAPGWMKDGDFHSTFPVWVRGKIRTGYTCNVLLRMGAKSVRGRRFSLARGKTGGEDTEFFQAIYQGGGLIAYAAEAWVEEPVPSNRAMLGWLVRRRFRVGQTHGALIGARAGAVRAAREAVLASAKAAYSLGTAALTVFSPIRRNRNALRAVMHAGVVSGLLGVRELQQYGMVSQKHEPTRAA